MGSWSNKSVVLDPIEFDGDMIVFSTKRLLVEDMQILMKFYDKETGNLAFSDPLEVCKTAGSIFPNYITDVKGMFSDGVEMSVTEFLEASKEFYFVPLIGALFGALISASTVKSKEKNSAPPALS